MAKPDLLSQLRDVHLPEEVSWWPLAIGWWVLIALSLLIMSIFAVKFIQNRRRTKYSRLALQELALLNNSTSDNWLLELEVLLKRAALSYFPSTSIAKLNNQAWIRFLLTTGESIWSESSLKTLRDSVYQDPKKLDGIDRALLLEQSQQWITALPKIELSTSNTSLNEVQGV